MAIETLFEVAGFITPQDVLYYRMLVHHEPMWANYFEFVFEIRHSGNVTHEFLAIAEFGGESPHVQFNLPYAEPLAIRLLSCISQQAIEPILIYYDKDPNVYLNCLKEKGLREIGAATIVSLLNCLANDSNGLRTLNAGN